MDKSSKTLDFGDIVGVHEARPVYMNRAGTELLPGNTQGYLDLRLVNRLGREKIVRVPVSDEVLDFFDEGSADVATELAAALQTAKG